MCQIPCGYREEGDTVSRYPTTNCSLDQLLALSSVLRKVFEVLQRDPTIFHKVETAVKEVHPSAVGRGLIWFFNRSGTRAVPAPQDVKRILVKLFPTKWMSQFKTDLRSYSCLGEKLTRHLKSFQSVVREFSLKWHNRSSTLFVHISHSSFAFAYALRVRIMTLRDHPILKLKVFQKYVVNLTKVKSVVTVKRIMEQAEENTGQKLLCVTTTDTPTGRQHRYVPGVLATTMLIGPPKRKREVSEPPAAASASSSECNMQDLVCIFFFGTWYMYLFFGTYFCKDKKHIFTYLY